MEDELRDNIARLTAIFAAASGLKESTILSRAAKDARFLDRTGEGARTFTIRVYDAALRWFSGNWPADAIWPADVPRPAPSEPESERAAS